MIDLSKFTQEEITDIRNLFLKNSQRSALDHYDLFTDKTIEKGVIYLISYRLLTNINNAMSDSNGKTELTNELNKNKDSYFKIMHLIEILRRDLHFGRSTARKRLFEQINQQEINELIDLTSILTEKTVLMSVSKLKGVILTGNSEKEFKRVMGES
jgi:hypothetical protein